jgi:hypothetical protein
MIEVFLKTENDKLRLINELRRTELPYRVRILAGGGRSAEQNRYLFGGCYDTILKRAGESLGGYTPHELHTYLCGEYWGWQTLQGLGRSRVRPVRTTTTDEDGKHALLSTSEFVDFTEFVRQFAAEHGIVIEDPYVEE